MSKHKPVKLGPPKCQHCGHAAHADSVCGNSVGRYGESGACGCEENLTTYCTIKHPGHACNLACSY